MGINAATALADFLEQRAKAVHAIEAEAEAIIHGKGDQAGYVDKMREKATLLSELAEDAESLVQALPPALAKAASERLGRFSQSAATSLSVGSPFFMSALLYPDDHTPGQPNDLDRYVDEVRGWA
ncbi:MAG: hypothetical protein RDU24_01405 [Humidesulfovibrio sp.]|uniref:hypothetical protein n=1 Tax=Humidesulfovibrio sp. TaxID=2910988 RepID=UPI0027E6CC58|nr:hypothetical protein [Humidesulfovibrio sp.]MDQ7834015.1 hypothetical protein [Humidesulfovibrio sp.]